MCQWQVTRPLSTRPPVEREAHVRAAVVERERRPVAPEDADRLGAGLAGQAARAAQLVQRPDRDPITHGDLPCDTRYRRRPRRHRRQRTDPPEQSQAGTGSRPPSTVGWMAAANPEGDAAGDAGGDADGSDPPPPVGARLADRGILRAEQLIYGIAAVALVAGAAALLVQAVVDFVGHLDDVVVAATELLGVLLLVFVFVELLGAVRVTIREQKLVAEPFLLVGIIASIKEIVLVAGAERPEDEGHEAFVEAMVEVGVLAAVILILAIAALLLRRREREPAEEGA